MKRLYVLLLLTVFIASCTAPVVPPFKVVLISANAEWRVIRKLYPAVTLTTSPFGEYFETQLTSGGHKEKVVFFHGGWGKVAAAASAQYCIDNFHPSYLLNLGTCGGFEGAIKRFDVILVNKTIIYDIREAMGDSQEAIRDFSTDIDLTWLRAAHPAAERNTLLVSADQDIIPAEINRLKTQYKAVAGDWESGAIAWVCARNHQRLLILRGVSDIVSPETGGEAYHHEEVFVAGTDSVMTRLVHDLPGWLSQCP